MSTKANPKKLFSVKDSFGKSSTTPKMETGGVNQSSALLRELAARGRQPAIASGLENIPVSQIISEGNPRTNFDEKSLNELAESIKKYGLIQPITVRKKGNEYHLIAGERRFRAVKINGEEYITAIVKNVNQIDPELIPEYKLIENIQREDLSDLEIALSITVIKIRNDLSAAQLAEKFHKSLSWVKQKLMHASAINDLTESETPEETNLLGKIPTSLLMEILPVLKTNSKEVFDWLLPKIESGDLPKQSEARQFAKTFKPKEAFIEKKKHSFANSEEILAEIEVIDKKISTLKKKKKELKDQLEKMPKK
ncbi:ParB/RepB/Spo0J family partition protein [Leptospira adleri]|uniref:Chromophore lyase n=1 Tax=Leptospira adleri TaxID=2023186 RepID=A0A2M9YJ10_9LEPT|nr:ParB/RepB/Spo0J family partition protein [Leptospira adleri]PJZ51486.1 chromophore lyase [Leptospira adleri]PJZ61606.1 chromophore lyase [Leptospira adleri]